MHPCVPDGRTVQVRTYSPFLDQWRTDPANQFAFTIPEPATGLLALGLASMLIGRPRPRPRPRSRRRSRSGARFAG